MNFSWSSLRKNFGFFKLGIITNLEYRVNFLTDVLLQPIMASAIELTVWLAVFEGAGTTLIGGFSKTSYLSYLLWGSFIGRINSNWMYEFRMMEDIETGAVNSFLVRPISFFEYYLSQFMGYKICSSLVSLLIPLSVSLWFHADLLLDRLPIAMVLVVYYLILVHVVSFFVASLAFHFNKVYSFTVAKNLALWLLSGELFPLDLLPSIWKNVLLALPFSNAVYVPVAYITGRAGNELLLQGFLTITGGLVFFGIAAKTLWTSSLRSYSGTGA